MSKSKNSHTVPRSVRHKQILDAAADQPDASLEELAAEVPSATAELVERVLDEYGDPADDHPDTPPKPGDSSMMQERGLPALDDLSSKQRKLLRVVYEQPQASQRELAEKLDVSRTTVSNRANSIEGFNWENRQDFVEAVFDTEVTMSRENNSQESITDTENQPSQNELLERVSAIERQIEELANTDESCSAFDDLNLLHKIVHACMESDAITEDEELQILKTLL